MTDSTNAGITNKISFSFPILQILTVIFVVAKLFFGLTWSWWLVLAPLWAPVALVLAILLVIAVFAGGAVLLAAIADKFSK